MEEKSNEIIAIPKVLENIAIKGQIITIDAMGTQTVIVETIRKRRADYVLAVKGNQGILETDIREYFEDEEIRWGIEKTAGYKRTAEKARGQVEIWEYYQTEEIDQLDGTEKTVEGTEKHRDGKKDHPKSRERRKRIPVLYQ